MKPKNKSVLTKYIICFCVASLMTVAVFAMRGFFNGDLTHNLIVLGDGFTVSGGLMLMFAGMMFISSEGALIGIGFVLRNAFLTFVPMGRAKQETYAQYRERKMSEVKKSSDHCLSVTGLVFFVIGLIFLGILYL